MIRLLGAACSPTQEEGEVISVYLQLCACLCPFTGSVSFSCAYFSPTWPKIERCKKVSLYFLWPFFFFFLVFLVSSCIGPCFFLPLPGSCTPTPFSVSVLEPWLGSGCPEGAAFNDVLRVGSLSWEVFQWKDYCSQCSHRAGLLVGSACSGSCMTLWLEFRMEPLWQQKVSESFVSSCCCGD